MTDKTICLIGPTACGKTDLAIRLTHLFPMDIISVDSAMIYRNMDIGTAKPSSAELMIAPHRLINICDPASTYSAGQFCIDAMREIKDIQSANRTPLLVGGTMLYFNKLLLGLADLPTADSSIREQLTVEAKQVGWVAMHDKLKKVDPIAADKIKPTDPQRIQRALEVFLLTKKPISELQQHLTPFLNPTDVTTIALIPTDRAWLHRTIEKRFDQMLKAGLVDEVRALHDRGDLHPDLPSMRIVGYRQVWEFLEGKTTFEVMREKTIVATRQLAKRQLTWLRSWKNLNVIDPQDDRVFEKVIDACQS